MMGTNESMGRAHYLCYKEATKKYGASVTLEEILRIGSELTIQCFLGYEGT